MKRIMVLALFPLLALLPMCSGGGNDSPIESTSSSSTDTSGSDASTSSASTAKGSLQVYLTDKPAEDYSAVNVTIEEVRFHMSDTAVEGDGDWVSMPVTGVDMPVNLLDLRDGVLLKLGLAELTEGSYQQVRLVLTPNSGSEPPYNQSVTTTADETTYPLDVPSGTLKLVHGFTVAAGLTTDLTLDFDALKSVVAKGNGTYSLKPVIKASSTTP